MIFIRPQDDETILDLVYPKNEIFVILACLDDETMSIETTCLIPANTFYTAKPIPYVTTENYVRCLSQASYLLGDYLIANHIIPAELDTGDFARAAAEYEIYYRNISMTFHERVARGVQFKLRLRLENVREIRRLDQDFLLFTFTNDRTVISGEMSFVQMR